TVTIGLIALLSLKEVLSASEKWNKYINNSFNLAIVPLLLSFVAIVFFKVLQIILLFHRSGDSCLLLLQSSFSYTFNTFYTLFTCFLYTFHMHFICFSYAF